MKKNLNKIIAIIIIIGFFFTITGCKNDNKSNNNTTNNKSNTFNLTDTLDINDSVEKLNWFYNDNNEFIWRINVNILKNNLYDYGIRSSYDFTTKERLFNYLYFNTTNLPKDKNSISLSIKKGSINGYKSNYESYKETFGDDYLSSESKYKDYFLFTNNRIDTVDAVKEISNSTIFVIGVEKNNIDNVKIEEYKTYLCSLIDTIEINKFNYSQFEKTNYLKEYEMGWNSAGGGHLYLNSSNVKIDNKLTLDLSNYSVSNINKPNYSIPENSFKYHADMIHLEYKDNKYFSFEIYYIENNNDNYFKQELSSDNYTKSKTKIKNIEFEAYKHIDNYRTYYKYDVKDGYYLFLNYTENFLDEFKAIIK